MESFEPRCFGRVGAFYPLRPVRGQIRSHWPNCIWREEGSEGVLWIACCVNPHTVQICREDSVRVASQSFRFVIEHIAMTMDSEGFVNLNAYGEGCHDRTRLLPVHDEDTFFSGTILEECDHVEDIEKHFDGDNMPMDVPAPTRSGCSATRAPFACCATLLREGGNENSLPTSKQITISHELYSAICRKAAMPSPQQDQMLIGGSNFGDVTLRVDRVGLISMLSIAEPVLSFLPWPNAQGGAASSGLLIVGQMGDLYLLTHDGEDFVVREWHLYSDLMSAASFGNFVVHSCSGDCYVSELKDPSEDAATHKLGGLGGEIVMIESFEESVFFFAAGGEILCAPFAHIGAQAKGEVHQIDPNQALFHFQGSKTILPEYIKSCQDIHNRSGSLLEDALKQCNRDLHFVIKQLNCRHLVAGIEPLPGEDCLRVCLNDEMTQKEVVAWEWPCNSIKFQSCTGAFKSSVARCDGADRLFLCQQLGCHFYVYTCIDLISKYTKDKLKVEANIEVDRCSDMMLLSTVTTETDPAVRQALGNPVPKSYDLHHSELRQEEGTTISRILPLQKEVGDVLLALQAVRDKVFCSSKDVISSELDSHLMYTMERLQQRLGALWYDARRI